MVHSSEQLDVYLETGKRRTFASVIDWPGWCRSGRDEEAALRALLDYGPRYAHVLETITLGFQPPVDVSSFSIIERLEGNATTDFGAPGAIPTADKEPPDDTELQRLQTVLKACWRALDATIAAATGRDLRKGPRGGGRDLDKIIQHVIDADAAYLRRLGQKNSEGTDDAIDQLNAVRQATLDALIAAAHGEIAARGPRGGVRWPPRYFVRRVAWHALDHAWEIEDRII